MPYLRQIAAEKANIINNNKKIYGAFAEIGAGQEVSNHFFKAGLASQTIAKSMSAYDMTFSDLIYGKASRYVCEERLTQMLNHEYSLLKNRLQKTKGKRCSFFAFADTVAASTIRKTKGGPRQHGWMGLRFQSRPMGQTSDILLHLHLKDRTRLQQYEVLGILGVNLIYTVFYSKKKLKNLVQSLVDNFEKARVEIDVLKCRGPYFKNMGEPSIELLNQNLSPLIVFTPKPESPMDAFFEKSLLLKTVSEKKPPALKKLKKTKNLLILDTAQMKSQTKYQSPAKPALFHRHKGWHELKKTLRQHSQHNLIFYFSKKEIYQFLKEKPSLLQAAAFFDNKTRILVEDSVKKDLLKRGGLFESFKKYLI